MDPEGNGAPDWFELACDLDPRLLGPPPTDVCFDLQYDAVVVGFADGMIATYDAMDLSVPHSCFKVSLIES
jgi:hypothetical protein